MYTYVCIYVYVYMCLLLFFVFGALLKWWSTMSPPSVVQQSTKKRRGGLKPLDTLPACSSGARPFLPQFSGKGPQGFRTVDP